MPKKITEGIKRKSRVTKKNTVAKKQIVPVIKELKIKKDVKNKKSVSKGESLPKIINPGMDNISEKNIVTDVEKQNKNKKIWRISLVFIIIGILFYGIYLALSFFDRTVVKLTPREEFVEFDYKILAQKQPREGELGFDIIGVQRTGEKEVQALEFIDIENKASGQIVVYNKFSRESQRLSPKTRFETPDGKIFLLGDGYITIPGMDGQKPGSIEVTVYANYGGEEYNIGLTDFTIPGFKEIESMDRYEKIYALSKTEMSGGSVGKKAVVGIDEKTRVENELKLRIKERMKSDILKQKTDKFTLLENSIKFTFDDSQVTTRDAKTFISVSSASVGVLINREHLESFIIKKQFLEELGDGVDILDINNIKISLIDNLDLVNLFSTKKINIEIFGGSETLWKIDSERFKTGILGYLPTEVLEYSSQHPGIEELSIKIYPMWRGVVSDREDKIKIKSS